jgi:hypothetical protein
MSWLQGFFRVRAHDEARLSRAGITSAEQLLERLTSPARLAELAAQTGIGEERLLGFAMQAQFLRLRGGRLRAEVESADAL